MGDRKDADIEEIQREIRYQVENYRHYRTEVSRFLRILIAFLGFVAALISSIDFIGGTFQGVPRLSIEQISEAGLQLGQSFEASFLPIPDLIGELIIQYLLVLSIIASAAALGFIGFGIPQSIYRVLKVRKIRSAPRMGQRSVKAYRGVLHYNQVKLDRVEAALDDIYSYTRYSIWGVAFTFVIYLTIFWFDSPLWAVYLGSVILFYFIVTTISPQSLRDSENELANSFDMILAFATVPTYVVISAPGPFSIQSISGWIVLALLGFFGYQLIDSKYDGRFNWISAKSIVLALIGLIVGGSILIARPGTPGFLSGVVITCISFSTGVMVILAMIPFYTSLDLLTEPVQKSIIAYKNSRFDQWQ